MANRSTPVVVTARSGPYVQTWRIPLELPQLDDCACVTDTLISISCRISELFYNVERHLCSVPPSPLSEWVEGEIIIDVFTSSTTPEDYTIEVTPVEDAMLRYIAGILLEVHDSALSCFSDLIQKCS